MTVATEGKWLPNNVKTLLLVSTLDLYLTLDLTLHVCVCVCVCVCVSNCLQLAGTAFSSRHLDWWDKQLFSYD